jgi:alpha-tubulin suppressor-like RCC1 family protein
MPWDSRRAWPIAVLTILLAGCSGQRGTTSGLSPASSAPPPLALASTSPPAEAHGPDYVLQIAAGDYHTCALRGDGTVRCWGRNKEGQLGDGTTTDRLSPVPVLGLGPVQALSLGANFSCALLRDKTVLCWGGGHTGGPPIGEPDHQPGSCSWSLDCPLAAVMRPTRVSDSLVDATQIDAGGIMACARLRSGKVVCWGSGRGPTTAVDSGAVEVSAGEAHACARMGDGTVRCWGDTPWSGSAPTLAHPVLAGAALQITTGDAVACARTGASGVVECWGRNEQGELGKGPDMDVHERPIAVAAATKAAQVAAGEAHLCAVLTDASVLCWGSNTDGELGRGTRSTTELPGPVPGLSGVADVALGADHACARLRDGNVACWGSNVSGQLGDGTRVSRPAPTPVVW